MEIMICRRCHDHKQIQTDSTAVGYDADNFFGKSRKMKIACASCREKTAKKGKREGIDVEESKRESKKAKVAVDKVARKELEDIDSTFRLLQESDITAAFSGELLTPTKPDPPSASLQAVMPPRRAHSPSPDARRTYSDMRYVRQQQGGESDDDHMSARCDEVSPSLEEINRIVKKKKNAKDVHYMFYRSARFQSHIYDHVCLYPKSYACVVALFAVVVMNTDTVKSLGFDIVNSVANAIAKMTDTGKGKRNIDFE